MRHMLIRHVSGPTYANTAVAAGLFLGTLFLLYRQSILVALGWTANLPLITGARFRPITTPEAVAAHYVYPRPPPPRFREWLHFAQLKRCELRQYDHIEQDLKPFRRLVADKGIDALQAAVNKSRELRDTAIFTIKGGKVYERHRHSVAGYAAGEYKGLLETIASRLPDVRFVVNLLDEPRVLLGPGSVHDRYASATCANASADFHESRHLHSFVISPASHVTDANTTLPVFSQTKIRGCHTDIMLPSHYNIKAQPARWHDTKPWHRRKPVLYWRGSTTGGICKDDTPFWKMHRQRLVGFSKNHSDMDMGLISYIQCSKKCCAEEEALYGLAKRVGAKENWKHRFLMILDGNSFNSRLPTFLSSGSLIFRAGLFGEWFDERIHPLKHYLPVRLDFSDLRARLDWALAHDREAHVMADAARRVAHRRLRYQDIQCYMYRLLLEYAALFGDATVPDQAPLKPLSRHS